MERTNRLKVLLAENKELTNRNLYLIKITRVGTRKEGQQDEDKNDFRFSVRDRVHHSAF